MKPIGCPSLTDLGHDRSLAPVTKQIDARYDILDIVMNVYEQLRRPICGRSVGGFVR